MDGASSFVATATGWGLPVYAGAGFGHWAPRDCDRRFHRFLSLFRLYIGGDATPPPRFCQIEIGRDGGPGVGGGTEKGLYAGIMQGFRGAPRPLVYWSRHGWEPLLPERWRSASGSIILEPGSPPRVAAVVAVPRLRRGR